MDSFHIREAAVSPPRSAPHDCGRFAVASGGLDDIQLAPPVPARISQAYDQDHFGPDIASPWQGSRANDVFVDDVALGQHVMHMQRQLVYMIGEQDKMQAMVGKVSVGMDVLLAQQLVDVQGDPPTGTARRPSSSGNGGDSGALRRRSYTVLPLQKQLLKDISGTREQNLDPTGVNAPAKTEGHRDGGRLSDSGTGSRSRDEEEVGSVREQSSRNHFADKRATENDDMCMLHELFHAAETADEEVETSYRSLGYLEYCRSVWRPTDRQAAEVMLESAISVVIGLNAICIGLSMDSSDEDRFAWTLVDVCFSVVFIVELSAQVWMNGFWFHFCGPRRCWRMVDASLIVMDLIQLLLAVALHDAFQGAENAPSVSLFRMVRLAKLARMLRLLNSSVFNDLLAMLQGMLGGLATLGWALVLFVVVIYVVALLFREFFGKEDVPNVSESFSSVPRSMFTTFRCSFGDCSAPSGVPIFAHVANEYGALSSLLYCLFVFVITIGLFNVISAIFVETTMASAAALQVQKKKNRLRDQTLWCTNVAKLVRRLMAVSKPEEDNPDVKLTEILKEVYQLEVPCEDIDLLVQDPEAISALMALDVAPEDRDYLSDILDPDSGGTINVIELVEGLRRLRGDPRRSDIVTINLMIRFLKRDLADIVEGLDKIFAAIHDRRSL